MLYLDLSMHVAQEISRLEGVCASHMPADPHRDLVLPGVDPIDPVLGLTVRAIEGTLMGLVDPAGTAGGVT
jgi:hypothetical protein